MARTKLGRHRDRIPGGLADKKKPSDFDPAALKEGIKVEMEHTSDSNIAREIAMDHLTEDSKYYVKLRAVEGKSVFDLFFKSDPDSHHRAYYRRSKRGKISRVKELGSPKPKPVSKPAPKLRAADWMGREFPGLDIPKDMEIMSFVSALGITLNMPIPPQAQKDRTLFDLTGDINSHCVVRAFYASKKMKKKGEEKKADEYWEPEEHHFYTTDFRKRQTREKFLRLQKLDPLFDKATETFRSIMSDDSRELITREAAAMLFIMAKTGFRHGDKEHFKKTGARGATTLASSSVTVTDDKCYFRFVGKKGAVNSGSIIDADLAKFLSWRKLQADRTFLWRYPDNHHINKVKEEAGISDFKDHDIRSLLACRYATLEFSKTKARFPKEASDKMQKVLWKKITDVGQAVDDKLCETSKGVTLKNYIDPAIVDEWIKSVGADPADIAKWVKHKETMLAEKSERADPGWAERFAALWKRIMGLKLAPLGKTEPSLDSSEDDPTED